MLMLRNIVFVVSLALCCLHVSPRLAEAQYAALLESFDSQNLTYDDKRFLQRALAFEGDYVGLLDGDWGPRSQRAMNAYARRVFGTESEEWHMAVLAISFIDQNDREGWDTEYIQSLGLSVLMPMEEIVLDDPSEHFVNFRHANSSLNYSAGRHEAFRAQNIHDYVERWNKVSQPPYVVRNNSFAVTSSKNQVGALLYARSDLINGKWSTILLEATGADAGLLTAVAGSIAKGRGDVFQISVGGELERSILQVLAVIEDDDETVSPESSSDQSSGTGFFVSIDGDVLTNAHVVEGCSRIFVNNELAQIGNVDSILDLALVKTRANDKNEIAFFSSAPARLNADVTVAGYPLSSILGGLNITRGAVSSTRGLGGSSLHMQITAPVQPGNSGGPVLDDHGHVIGVVVSKLDAVSVASMIGDIPQNVNFAIRGELAKLFLSQNGIEPTIGTTSDNLEPEKLADIASSFTAYIECK